ncbi:MAG: hypothetical protein MJ244_04395 [Clostridia bacterium]|nr:hypothetical protein [Clostridia bacterium]
MVDLKKLKRAIDIQKEIIINELIDRSNNEEKLKADEVKMLEKYYQDVKED